ncbi:hypothetical protein ACH5RR_013427 [Cinchona calisaya]|uniref:Uncharacterized protein n=1 Tax=Cinchona calisaya TaxID=153742 RepID=A0ABD3A3C1_9GENT
MKKKGMENMMDSGRGLKARMVVEGDMREEIEAYRKALAGKIEKLTNEKISLDEVNNKFLDRVMEKKHQAHDETELSKKIKLSLKEVQDNVVLRIVEAEVNMKLHIINIELRIQELNEGFYPPAPIPGSDEENEDPKEVVEELKEIVVEV